MLRCAVLLLGLLLASVASAAGGQWPGTKPAETQALGCARFTQAGVEGSFVLYDPAAEALRSCNPSRAAQRLLPASTFKIVNALNALDNGIVRDEDELIAWDGVERDVPAWNQDTTLASGMSNSTVWFYQEIARRTGPALMQAWLDRLEYGNRNIDGGIDRFWLDGGLRISAYEQVAFLDRLRRGALPVSARSQAVVARILELEHGPDWVWRGKTGAALRVDVIDAGLQVGTGQADNTGWLVGWVEREGRDYVYALNIHLRDSGDMPLRKTLLRELLTDNGVLPASATP